jgi:hypothetical protein
VKGTPGALASCPNANAFQQAITGCDQNTIYTCGTPSTSVGATQLDLTENPVNPPATGDMETAATCLINQTVQSDSLDTTTFPFQIRAGLGNPLVQAGIVKPNDSVTTSNNIVTLPILDNSSAFGTGNNPPVTIVGFLQVFINNVDSTGRPTVTVLNVSGCSNNASKLPVSGTSPVPVRLITPP